MFTFFKLETGILFLQHKGSCCDRHMLQTHHRHICMSKIRLKHGGLIKAWWAWDHTGLDCFPFDAKNQSHYLLSVAYESLCCAWLWLSLSLLLIDQQAERQQLRAFICMRLSSLSRASIWALVISDIWLLTDWYFSLIVNFLTLAIHTELEIMLAGAIEAVFSVLALHHRVAPPTLNLEKEDPQLLGKMLVRTLAEALPETSITGHSAAMSNSFGFGGTNASLVFTTPPWACTSECMIQ